MAGLAPELAKHPFFEGLADDHLATVADCANEARFAVGEPIFHEGEAADRFYVIRSGRVTVEVFRLDQGPIVVQELASGDLLGWSWLVPPYRWRFDARAREETLAYAIDGCSLRARCDQDPSLGYALLRRIAAAMERRLMGARQELLKVSAGVP